MNRAYYSSDISEFKKSTPEHILGQLARQSDFSDVPSQKEAWNEEIEILKKTLKKYEGAIYFEFSIPRMGRRIDVLLIIGSVIFVLEFKIGAKDFSLNALDQVWDYALDLKNFHETSHLPTITPILICTEAKTKHTDISISESADRILRPMKCNIENLQTAIDEVLRMSEGESIQLKNWEAGRYSPTPTVVEAAMALYKGHSVEDITRSDAGAENLRITADTISGIIKRSRTEHSKSICFVTGVPGAGKTLVGLDIATKHINKESELYSVYLSGNGPLVAVLREALTRDKIANEKSGGKKLKKGEVFSDVKMFIQNVHNFRDEYLRDKNNPPIEHVALFDEAQRAWTKEKTANFMARKKNTKSFERSEPEFLISCLDRHQDWATIVCLVGGGQEINTGEAGISEWIKALRRSFRNWDIYISPNLKDSEYDADAVVQAYKSIGQVYEKEELHLAVSMRSFRAENVSSLVKQILDIEIEYAKTDLGKLKSKYPVVLTRNLTRAKEWIRDHARGTERYGLIASSQAERLKPDAVFVKAPVNPIHWFLNDKMDVRSSYYLEDVATEFMIQGLELDWTCVAWDADFRYTPDGWSQYSFHGKKWKNIWKPECKAYQKNAYRVLLTRARQGMVIFVPEGNPRDHTRLPEFYDGTLGYLQSIGFETI